MSTRSGRPRLKGMTWSHPRGYDPLVACSALYRDRTGVEIEWDKRSLQDFESYPVEELARAYDMIVIDHPHIGQVVREGCLLPLDSERHADGLRGLAADAVGPSFDSYTWQGRQWALPIDTASQVQAFRPDLIDGPATSLDQVLGLAREGKLLLPLKTPHAIMTFFTLAANMGTPCGVGGELIDAEAGARVYAAMKAITDGIAPANFDLDPIDGLERLAAADSAEALIPYVFGYVSYAREGFRSAALRFVDIPSVDGATPRGSVIGGTGLAISAYCEHPEAARDFAFWVSGAEVQSGPYAEAGGQPAHRRAWLSDEVNEPVHGFYRDTLRTLDLTYLRPRFDGYMAFQDAASRRLAAGLQAGEAAGVVVDDLRRLFGEHGGQAAL